jgi:hypothetical protein
MNPAKTHPTKQHMPKQVLPLHRAWAIIILFKNILKYFFLIFDIKIIKKIKIILI